MTVLIENPAQEQNFIEQRRRLGIDRHDEVWNGVYIVSPDPNNEHQQIVSRLCHCFLDSVEIEGLGLVYVGGNVTDQDDDWTKNYRCPDVAVFLRGTTAQDRGTHWLGGPDFAVEVISKGDRSRQKFDFYAAVGTRELLLIDREPWALELYRLEGSSYILVGKSEPGRPDVLTSAVLPLSFRLAEGQPRPTIEVRHADGVQTWAV